MNVEYFIAHSLKNNSNIECADLHTYYKLKLFLIKGDIGHTIIVEDNTHINSTLNLIIMDIVKVIFLTYNISYEEYTVSLRYPIIQIDYSTYSIVEHIGNPTPSYNGVVTVEYLYELLFRNMRRYPIYFSEIRNKDYINTSIFHNKVIEYETD